MIIYIYYMHTFGKHQQAELRAEINVTEAHTAAVDALRCLSGFTAGSKALQKTSWTRR
jgi:hypothetical protein